VAKRLEDHLVGKPSLPRTFVLHHGEQQAVPIHGTDRAIARLRKEYRVVIHSARCSTEEGRKAIESWLEKHRIEVDDVCEHKPPAFVYIDDRALKFTGDWGETMNQLSEFRK